MGKQQSSGQVVELETAPRDLREEIGKAEPFAQPSQEFYLNLVMTHDVLHAAHDRLFRQHGISEPLFNILRILRGHELTAGRRGGGEPKSNAGVPSLQIGREMITREPDVTRLVDRLEKMGLVTRARGTADRRVVFVRLTDAGRRMADEVMVPAIDLIRERLAHLSEEDFATLNRLLFKARHPG